MIRSGRLYPKRYEPATPLRFSIPDQSTVGSVVGSNPPSGPGRSPDLNPDRSHESRTGTGLVAWLTMLARDRFMSERLVEANGVELCIETFGDPARPAGRSIR